MARSGSPLNTSAKDSVIEVNDDYQALPDVSASMDDSKQSEAETIAAAHMVINQAHSFENAKAKFLSGQKLEEDEEQLLEKNLKGALINFKGEYYRNKHPYVYSKYLIENFGAMALEVAYAIFQFQVSQSGVSDFAESVLGVDISDGLATTLGATGALFDFISNITTFDVAGDANYLITKYAEDKSMREKASDLANNLRQIPVKTSLGLLFAAAHTAICVIHNLTGGYADIDGVKDKLEKGSASFYLVCGLTLHFTNVYYNRFITPKYYKGLENHLTRESLTAKMLKGEIALPLHVGLQVTSSAALRAVSFAYLADEAQSYLANTYLDKLFQLPSSAVGGIVLFHTLISRFFPTYNKYYNAVDGIKKFIDDGDPRIMQALTQGTGLKIEDIKQVPPAVIKALLEQLATKLRQDRSYGAALKEEYPTVVLGAARVANISYLAGALSTLLPFTAIPQVAFYVAGGLLALGHFYRAESQHVSDKIVFEHFNDVMNVEKEIHSKTSWMINGFASICCAISNLTRGIGNVTFGVSQGKQYNVAKDLAVSTSSSLSLETSVNGYFFTVDNNKDTMKIIPGNAKSLLKWMTSSCRRQPQNGYQALPEPAEEQKQQSAMRLSN
jgi:hypothetical protein